MARIVAGYTIEHEELVKLLETAGWGPGPGEPEFSPKDAMMAFISWRYAQPKPEDTAKQLPLPRPQYWFDKDEKLILAFMTRYSAEKDNWKTLRFREMPIDIEIRNMFIAYTGNVLDPQKMHFWSTPETYLHLPLATRLILD
ncbi:hypothetical protein EWM64_g10437 [Hericium alpestre]|uniref:Uncharacterized protein n=1 Tax=Hericium alpestre TaxID=135208 RepID=A0A4Y9ZFQ8_9AGAM|nr:hypothetical protein EWM64_g10437 [Hericium alpestre]